MFNNTAMSGMSMGFPDVCKTPVGPAPVPLPYPNMAEEPANVPPMPTVFYGCGPAHVVTGITPMSEGDNAGVEGGLVSQLEAGPEKTTLPSMNVFVDGQPVDKLTSPTMHNLINSIGAKLVPSQVTVMTLG